MAQNFDIFDFTLSDDDMSQIATLNQQDAGFINFGDPQFVKYLIENYGYCYEKNSNNIICTIDYDNSKRTDVDRASKGIGSMCLSDGTG